MCIPINVSPSHLKQEVRAFMSDLIQKILPQPMEPP